jgi:hypothetical protein
MKRSTSLLVLAIAVVTAACAGTVTTPVPSSASARTHASIAAVAEPLAAVAVVPSQVPIAPSQRPAPEQVELVSVASSTPVDPAAGTWPLDGPFSGPETMVVRMYFMLDAESGAAGLVPVLREVPVSGSVDLSAVEALLAGPHQSELGVSPRISSRIPDGTRLLEFTVNDGIATVDLTDEFEAPGDRMSALGRLGQIVYTLTAYPWIRAVDFKVEGRAVAALADGEVVLTGPVGRADPRDIGPNEPFFEAILPSIFVDGPSWGEKLHGQALVTGTARLARDQFMISAFDAAGRKLSEVGATEPCAGPCGGGFEARIDFVVPQPQWGTLRVAEVGPTGAFIPLPRDYPVWLIPGDATDSGHCGC